MLGHDCHSIVASEEHADELVTQLEVDKEKGYTLVLSGHYTSETLKDEIAK